MRMAPLDLHPDNLHSRGAALEALGLTRGQVGWGPSGAPWALTPDPGNVLPPPSS